MRAILPPLRRPFHSLSGVTLDGSATPAGSNCAPAGAGTVQCARPVITAGSTDTFTVDLQADHTVTGVVHVLGSSTDGSLTSNTADDPVTVDTSADLALSDVATPSASPGVTVGDAVAGGTIAYALTVTNSGPSDSQGFTVTDQLPEGATFVSSSPTGCTASPGGPGLGDLVSCTEGVATTPSHSTLVTIRAQISASEPANGAWADSAMIASTQTTDPTPGDTASKSVNLVTRSDLALTESAAVPTGASYEPSTQNGMVVAGDTHAYSYTLTVTNGGPSDNQGFVVQDVLPHGALFDGVDSTGGCVVAAPGDALNGDTVQCTVSSVTAPLGDPSFTAATTASSEPANGAYTDSASIFSSQTVDPSNGNDTELAPAQPRRACRLDPCQLRGLARSDAPYLRQQQSGTEHRDVHLQRRQRWAVGWSCCDRDVDAERASWSAPATGGVLTLARPPALSRIPPVASSASARPAPSRTARRSMSSSLPRPIPHSASVRRTAPSRLSRASAPPRPPKTTDLSDNSAADSPGVTIDTVPTVPLSQFAIPGTNNAILTWEKPQSDGGKPIRNYQIKVTPFGGSTTTLPLFAASNPHTTACAESVNHDCYQFTVTGLPPITGGYSFGIAALNDVGTGDTATAQATPSADTQNALYRRIRARRSRRA